MHAHDQSINKSMSRYSLNYFNSHYLTSQCILKRKSLDIQQSALLTTKINVKIPYNINKQMRTLSNMNKGRQFIDKYYDGNSGLHLNHFHFHIKTARKMEPQEQAVQNCLSLT